jgi:hypothetical protein
MASSSPGIYVLFDFAIFSNFAMYFNLFSFISVFSAAVFLTACIISITDIPHISVAVNFSAVLPYFTETLGLLFIVISFFNPVGNFVKSNLSSFARPMMNSKSKSSELYPGYNCGF